MIISKPQILYIDNEEESCLSFRAVFRRDYNIYTTVEPLEVSALIEQKGINILMTDYTMPMLKGTTLLEFIRQHYPKIRRVLVTGSVDRKLRENLLMDNLIEAWITKPWSKSEMDQVIKDVFYIE